jgi:uncharacterized glyoxalase superfamily protein PhnB
VATCIPFLAVLDIEQTIKWYEAIGFTCIGTNHIWEPGCELNWAHLDWEGASFMIGPDIRKKASDANEIKDASLYFNMGSIDKIMEQLKDKVEIMELNEETFYGNKEVSFIDLNGFRITFSCEPDKK